VKASAVTAGVCPSGIIFVRVGAAVGRAKVEGRGEVIVDAKGLFVRIRNTSETAPTTEKTSLARNC
jgi:hypothetical protein